MASPKELKEINAQKKALAEKAKAIREELNETKEERKAARSKQAECRRQVKEQKKRVRDLVANIYPMFSTGDAQAVRNLASELANSCEELIYTVNEFADAKAEIEGVL